MNRTLKIVFACAFGAGIGGLIALQIGGYFWWIGMIIGATIAYFSIEFKAVLKAIVYAWKKIVDEFRNLKPSKELKGIFWFLIFLSNVYTSGFALIVLDKGINIRHLTLYLICVWVYATFYAFFSSAEEFGKLSDRDKILVLSLSPILFFFFWPVAFLFRVVRAIFKALPVIGRFGKTIFVQIHSDERLLCFFDAGIGVAIGYFAGHALIGALAGGILGAINYEIVSKRWLKLVPVKF